MHIVRTDCFVTSGFYELKESGRCEVPATEEECKNAQNYLFRYDRWQGIAGQQEVGGCYSPTWTNKVYFNSEKGTDCGEYKPCICMKPGKVVLF